MRSRSRGRTRSLRDTSDGVLPKRVEQRVRMASEPENRETNPIPSLEAAAPSPLVAALQQEHTEWVADVIEAFREITIVVPREHIVAACLFLKTSPDTRFDFLADICGADRGVEEEPRFEVKYHLFSTTKHHRLRSEERRVGK